MWRVLRLWRFGWGRTFGPFTVLYGLTEAFGPGYYFSAPLALVVLAFVCVVEGVEECRSFACAALRPE